MTAQGHPRAIFKRAIERGNLVVAEASAREAARLTLEEALSLVFLYAEKDPAGTRRLLRAGSTATWPRGRRSRC
jgi:hypothetical protein